MSEITLPTYPAVEAALKEQGLAAMPAELHGLLSGMICGGLAVDDEAGLVLYVIMPMKASH